MNKYDFFFKLHGGGRHVKAKEKNLFAYHLLSIFLRSRHTSLWPKVYLRSDKHKQKTKTVSLQLTGDA